MPTKTGGLQAIQAYSDIEGYDNSWKYDIELTKDGDINIIGIMSTNSQSGSSWNVETYCVLSIRGWKVEIDSIRENMENDDKFKDG